LRAVGDAQHDASLSAESDAEFSRVCAFWPVFGVSGNQRRFLEVDFDADLSEEGWQSRCELQ
jgi:hypothetical protein